MIIDTKAKIDKSMEVAIFQTHVMILLTEYRLAFAEGLQEPRSWPSAYPCPLFASGS